MRYLITHPDHKPFYSIVFDPSEHWIEGMTVYDVIDGTHMSKRHEWQLTIIDSL